MLQHIINASEAIKLTREHIKALFAEHVDLVVVLDTNTNCKKDRLILSHDTGTYHKIGYIEYIRIMYGEYVIEDMDDGVLSEEGWMVCGMDQYPNDQTDKAIDAFMKRLKSDTPSKAIKDGMSLQEIKAHYESLSIQHHPV